MAVAVALLENTHIEALSPPLHAAVVAPSPSPSNIHEPDQALQLQLCAGSSAKAHAGFMHVCIRCCHPCCLTRMVVEFCCTGCSAFCSKLKNYNGYPSQPQIKYN